MEYFAYSQKSFIYKYVVMLSDTDQFEHMSFANYLKLMFLATDALFISCSNVDFMSNNRLKLENSRMQFKKQTMVGDRLLIKVNSSEVRESSFSLLFTFTIEDSGDLVGLGKKTYCVVGAKDGKPKKLSVSNGNLLGPISVLEDNLLYKY